MQERVSCGLKRGTKQFKRNDKLYTRLADHIGLFPAVMIAPDDAALIHDGSEMRRKWLDAVISQYDRGYLEALIDFNKSLAQRTPCFGTSPRTGPSTRPCCLPGTPGWPRKRPKCRGRTTFMDDFSPGFLSTCEEISGGAEAVSLSLKTHVVGDASAIEEMMEQAKTTTADCGARPWGAQGRRGVQVGRTRAQQVWQPGSAEVVFGVLG